MPVPFNAQPQAPALSQAMRLLAQLTSAFPCLFLLVFLLSISSRSACSDDEIQVDELASVLRKLKSDVLSADNRKDILEEIRQAPRRHLKRANDYSREWWSGVKSRQDWERHRQPQIDALRRSLGQFPEPPNEIKIRITGKLSGDGYQIENLVFESRLGLWVTANLYLPAQPAEPMPGILICHSHHRPKEHGELQDMGMTWARQGCMVLVPDHLGHGERRQHPFAAAKDYDGSFRVSRQDYYFRYDTAAQLHLIGDSLIGWMVWDLMRGVDVLLSRDGVDPKRIIMLGAVAGGGDPCAVAAALDERVACAVPFNFGGPQPETRYPLPEDVETSFNYAGSGGWESTRNLRRSAADGFLPWVIVGGIAPRRLVFAHEFNWDRQRDPVWKRLQAIYNFHDAADNLSFTHGRGELTGDRAVATHCTHIGKFHRRLIHSSLKRWFKIEVTEADEYSNRRPEEELLCMPPEVQDELKPKRLVDLLPQLTSQRLAKARRDRDKLPLAELRDSLRRQWANLLGEIEPPQGTYFRQDRRDLPAVRVEWNGICFFAPDLEATLPLVLLIPTSAPEDKPRPVVMAVAQAGKAAFLQHRAREIAELLAGGCAVLLADVRGTGEVKLGSERGRRGYDTNRSSTELMLGSTMVGARLHDLRAIIRGLKESERIDSSRMALWGDSFADVNDSDTDINVPRGVDGRPQQSEPLGGLLVFLAALFEDNVRGVYVRGGLASFESVLNHQQVLVPHDVVVPGVLTIGDLNDLAAALVPRRMRLDGLVDGLNRRLSPATARTIYESTLDKYHQAGAEDAITIAAEMSSPTEWLLETLEDR